ncbi:MAG: HEAT repeat domain-containing protein [Candidatus Helarchaeota archaeon]
MPKKRSAAWERFYYEFFGRSGYEQWHDGVDPDVVLDLKGEEREEAEDLLIKSAEKGEMWPTKGLIVLKSKKALPLLKKQLKNLGYGVQRIRVAEAIVSIEENTENVAVLIDELHNNPSPYDRLEAAMVLKNFPRQDVVDALYKAIMDPDFLVRNHAAESLLAIHGISSKIADYDEIFTYICYDEEFAKEAGDNLDPKLRGKDYDMVHSQAIKMLKDLFKDKKIVGKV